jgi:6-phosphofructokinase 1
MSKRLRVGLLTGGGDCPGLNAVIRAVTKSLTLEHGAEVFGFEDGFEGMIERKMRPLGYRDVSGILTRGGTILGSSNRGNPFRYFRRGGEDVSDDVVRYCRDLELTAVVAIGGDGTMSIAHRLQQKGVPFVGVPKTIDNDLVGTDRTFGFNSAVTIVTEAIDRLHTTAQSHDRIMIIETMGRYAGWIALYAGVAGGADVILIPEIEYDVEEIARVCRAREGGGQSFTIVVVAEGAKPIGGEQAIQEVVESSPDPIRLGGISRVLQEQLESHVDSEIRATILGHTQRGGTPTPFDRILGTTFGSYAAAMVTDGQFGRMVALQDNRLTSVSLAEVANKTRTIPLDAPVLQAARAVGTSFGVVDLDLRMEGSKPSASVS